jgi:hypothetical protein
VLYYAMEMNLNSSPAFAHMHDEVVSVSIELEASEICK